MLSRILTAAAVVAGAATLGMPTAQAAPDVNAMPPISPVDFTVMEGAWYAFTAPGGLTCVINKGGGGGYGCSGALPGAPNGANVVSAGPAGAPGFANSDRPIFGVVVEAKELPANSRISYQHVSCGTDGVETSCVNSYDQSGFVVGPGGSYILNEVNPLLDRPEGTNPYFN